MQDWPIEVADAERVDDFLALLVMHRDDWELTHCFLDLVLESARGRKDREVALLGAIVSVVEATRAPSLFERLEYWAQINEPLENAFEVSPIVREALVKLA
jgi:hypothetical protein